MEDFSQSRGDDDLFDDEIVPIEDTAEQPTPPSPEKITTQPAQATPSSSDPPTESPDFSKHANAAVPLGHSSHRLSSNRGAPRGRGTRGQVLLPSRGIRKPSTGLGDSKWAPKAPSERTKEAESSSKDSRSPTASPAAPPKSPPASESNDAATTTATTTTAAAAAAAAPTSTTSTATTRPPAVRGDRTATGGVSRPKLTEEELGAKIAAAKARSETLAAAHARAVADAESFEERERIAMQKRAKEKIDIAKLEGERERNRARKMRGMGGREWDAGKDESDFRGTGSGRGSGRGRGRMWDPTRSVESQILDEREELRQYEWNDDRGRGRGRGGRGRGRGRGRGEFNGETQRQPDVKADTDFPALPTTGAAPKVAGEGPASTTVSGGKPPVQRQDSVNDSGGAGGSWADQVEAAAPKAGS